jgi:hypothetical protein
MMLARDLAKAQVQLKRQLQAKEPAGVLEKLAGALIGRLLGTPIFVARSGFQHGGDAGTAGQHDRRLRLECKRYSDKTAFNDRELTGEIDQALRADEALEGWFLIATRPVPEQLAQLLTQHGERLGVPVGIIEWHHTDVAPLAALCTSDPDLVGKYISKTAADLSRQLSVVAKPAVEALRTGMHSWCLGYESVRSASHDLLDRVWTLPAVSAAQLNQNAAGGSRTKRVIRRTLDLALSDWWEGAAKMDAPAAVVGRDGVGKTWNTLDWVIRHRPQLPITLFVSSSAFPSTSVSEAVLKQFLAEQLFGLTGVRDMAHWMRRLGNLLKRPIAEGPVITLILDGLNQRPDVDWRQVLRVLQAPPFQGCVRTVGTTRTFHFEDKLSKLRGLVVPAVTVPLDLYDTSSGSELDQMLALEGLTRSDLRADLFEHARVPRLFALIVKFRDRFVEPGQVTIHRLLWEYGRDTLGVRAGHSFSEEQWREWLREIASQHRKGPQEYSPGTLGSTTHRPDLTQTEVYARLSDIIDGRLTRAGPTGGLMLIPAVVHHALGASLLTRLDSVQPPKFTACELALHEWLDPIESFDERAHILRAAVSIWVERDDHDAPAVVSALVTALLQSPNIPDEVPGELRILAPQIPDALLEAIERSSAPGQFAARMGAISALRTISCDETAARIRLIERAIQWLSTVSLSFHPDESMKAQNDSRAERLNTRLGVTVAGRVGVLGHSFHFVDYQDDNLQALVPSILEGFPLASASICFEVAAIRFAIMGRTVCWSDLKWLCRLNELDPVETAARLRETALRLCQQTPEPAVHPQLGKRAAELLLYLCEQDADERLAAAIDSGLDHPYTYERDYLANPAGSMFPLEWRHAASALEERGVALFARVQRTKDVWCDPAFLPPFSFVDEVRSAMSNFAIEKMGRQEYRALEEHTFEEFEPVLARCCPELLVSLARRKLMDFADRPPEARYWSAIQAYEHLLVTDSSALEAAARLRRSAREDDAAHEAIAAWRLLALEIADLPVQGQVERLMEADLPAISTDLAHVLGKPPAWEVDAWIARYASGTANEVRDLVDVLSIHPIDFTHAAWTWLRSQACANDADVAGLVFKTLFLADTLRLGRELQAEAWSWGPGQHWWVNHYGSAALLRVTPEIPFDKLAPRLAPWLLLEAARARGADAAEIRLAAEQLGHTLLNDTLPEFDPGAAISIGRSVSAHIPMLISIEPREKPAEDDFPAQWMAAHDTAGRIEAHRLARTTTLERIATARRAGAYLLLAPIEVDDLGLAIKCAPTQVHEWLEGCEDLTAAFRKRVALADSCYVALCEALLLQDPPRGVLLWRALRGGLQTQYRGVAGIDELIHMVFRVPPSREVQSLRRALWEPPLCRTDQQLLQMSIAASINQQTGWLMAAITDDEQSALLWRRQRGQRARGFLAGNTLPIPEAWPTGPMQTTREFLEQASARSRWSEACAHHWWRAYLDAQDVEAAYAAWVLLLHSADYRAYIWMTSDLNNRDESEPLMRRKLMHARLNMTSLERAARERLGKLERKYLNEDIADGIGPWARGGQSRGYTTRRVLNSVVTSG